MDVGRKDNQDIQVDASAASFFLLQSSKMEALPPIQIDLTSFHHLSQYKREDMYNDILGSLLLKGICFKHLLKPLFESIFLESTFLKSK